CLPFMTEGHEFGARAAEFVLGTLDTAERAEARALLGGDDKFSVQVKEWERRLGELHLMVEPVEPESQVWERVKTRIGGFDAPPVFEPPAAEQIAPESSPLPPLPPVPPPTEEPASPESAPVVSAFPELASPAPELAESLISEPVSSTPAERAPESEHTVPVLVPSASRERMPVPVVL